MPVDLNFGNDMVAAYSRGVQESEEQKKRLQDAADRQIALKQHQQQLDQEAEHYKNLIELSRSAQALQATKDAQGAQVQQSKMDVQQFINPQNPVASRFLPIDPNEAARRERIGLQPNIEAKNAEVEATQAAMTKREKEIEGLKAKAALDKEAEMQRNRVLLEGVKGVGRMDLAKYTQGQANYRATLKGQNQKADTQTRILATAHDNNPLTRDAVLLRSAVKDIENIPDEGSDSAADMHLIYAYAKAMDPASAVKEGEYAVVQRYAQSWKDKFGFDVNRIFNNSEFLTPEARKNLKRQIRNRSDAIGTVYNDYRKNIINRIETTSGGKVNGADYLGMSPADFGKAKEDKVTIKSDDKAAYSAIPAGQTYFIEGDPTPYQKKAK